MPASDHRRADLAAGGVLWLAAIALAVDTVRDDLRLPLAARQADLHVYLGAVHAMLHGGSLYGYEGPRAAPFLYPPGTAAIFAPLTWFGEQSVRVGWSIATAVLVLGAAALLARWLPWEAARTWPVVASGALAVVLVTSGPFRSNLAMGQVSVPLTIMTLVDALTMRGRRGQGVLTGLAGAVKLTPLLFVPFFWMTGQRRAAVQAAVTFAAFTVASAVVLPHESWRYWTHEVVSSSRTEGLVGKSGNQSLLGLMAHTTHVGGGVRAAWLVAALTLGVLGLVQAVRAERRGEHFAAVVLCGVTTVVVSPLSWNHHQLWIVLLAGIVVSSNLAVQVAWMVLVIVVDHPGGLPLQVFGHHGLANWIEHNQKGLLALFAVVVLPLLPRPRPVPRVVSEPAAPVP